VHVALDIDGVLRDFIGALQRVYRREHPDHTTLEVTEWDVRKFFPPGIVEFMGQHKEELMAEADPFPGLTAGLRQLGSLPHTYHVITSSMKGTESSTCAWLAMHVTPFLEVQSLMFATDKTLHTADILVDDRVENLVGWAGAGERAICFDQPWNKDWKGQRVRSYAALYNTLKSLA